MKRPPYLIPALLLAAIAIALFWPTPLPANRVQLSELISQSSPGPLLAPQDMLGHYASTPFLPTGWSTLTGDDFRTAEDTVNGAVVSFYLSQKVPLSIDLRGREEKAGGPVSLLLQGREIQKFPLSSEWKGCHTEVSPENLNEGLNRLLILADHPTQWLDCQFSVLNSYNVTSQNPTSNERTNLVFGHSIEIPILLRPSTSLVIDDVQTWIEPGAPSLDSPWELIVRLQSSGSQKIDQSWPINRGGRHEIRLPVDTPTQVTLSLLATSSNQPLAGQAGLSLNNARLDSQSPAPLISTPRVSKATLPGYRPNIILYVVDTVRADHLHCYGGSGRTPHFDALSGDGVRFANCMAQSSWTKASLGSIMTSLLPHEHGAEDFPDVLSPSLDTLAKILSKAGYENQGIVANPFVSRSFGFAEGFAGYLEMPDAEAHRLTKAVYTWLDQRKADRPFFLYVHVLDPHLPYSPPSQFHPADCPAAFTVEDMKSLREAWQTSHAGSRRLKGLLRQAMALYDGEIENCDDAFGQFVSSLKARGIYDDSMIILVSDHGEQFFEHGLCDHMNSLYQGLLHVPLIIKFPRNQHHGSVVEPVWQHIDIAPTILFQAGLTPPVVMKGLPYVPGGTGGSDERPAYFSLNVGKKSAQYGQGEGLARADMEGIRTGPWVFNRTLASIADVEPIQLFNLKTDPEQNRNLAFIRPEVRTWLQALLRLEPKPGIPAASVSQSALQSSLRSNQYLRWNLTYEGKSANIGKGKRMELYKNWWARYTLAFTILMGCHLTYGGFFSWLPTSTLPADSQPERIEKFLDATWEGKAQTGDLDPLLRESGLCWVIGFGGGYPESHQISLWENRATACARLLADPHLREMEAVEVGLATNLTLYKHEDIERDKIGLWGLLLRCSNGDLCLTPAEFPRRSELLETVSIKYMNERTVLKQAKFQALTWLLRHDSEYHPHLTVRGETVVTPESLTRETVSGAAHQLAGFEQRMVKQHDGLIPYRYGLTTGLPTEEDKNIVKTCLASLSLANYARYSGVKEDRDVAQKHLSTMIARFGHRFEDKTYIFDSDSSLLGAQAIFALALRRQPQPDAFFKEFEKGLALNIRESLQPDGHFQTSCAAPGSSPETAIDPEKDENQNSFPGMALTYLAHCSQEGAPIVTTQILDNSLQYYMLRFRRRPDKSSIPWLAEAFRQRFLLDHQRAAAENAFLLVDWNLNNLQKWTEMEPQMRGGLINPERLQYGRFCFTWDVAGQLQGLAAADSLATLVGDSERHKRYEAAILEMSRYLRQMQIREKADLYWLPASLREAPQGGMRDAAWAFKMQVDSSASALNAWTCWLNSAQN